MTLLLEDEILTYPRMTTASPAVPGTIGPNCQRPHEPKPKARVLSDTVRA
jgi:hypothetical protein